MSDNRLLVGSSLPALERTAFQRVAERVTPQVANVLYVGGDDHDRESTRRRWEAVAPARSLRVGSVYSFVTNGYERTAYAGRATHVDRPLLVRLVEAALERLSPENPLTTPERLPPAGVVDLAETLFSDLEFAGHQEPAAVRAALTDAGLETRADHVAAFTEAVRTVRCETLTDEIEATFQSERLAAVAGVASADTPGAATDASLADVFPAVDHVIVGDLSHPDELTARLLERIAETWPTTALCLGTAADATDGLDAARRRTRAVYDNLGFDTDHVRGDDTGVVDALYRHPSAVATQTADPDAVGLATVEPRTPAAEARLVARDVRERLADGTPPAEIAVVLPGRAAAERVATTFDHYDVPHDLAVDTPLADTDLGAVVTAVADLATPPRAPARLVDLVTNPLVGGGGDTVEDDTGADDTAADDTAPSAGATDDTGAEWIAAVDERTLAETVDRVEATDLATVRRPLPSRDASAVDRLLDRITELATAPLSAVDTTLDTLLSELGVDPPPDADERLAAVTRALSVTATAADETRGTTTERLRRALRKEAVSGDTRDGGVTVGTLTETVGGGFNVRYVLGVTDEQLPRSHERPALTRPVYEHVLPAEPDRVAESRLALAAHTTAAGETILSTPRQDGDGTPRSPAGFLTELGRLVDLDATRLDWAETRPRTGGGGDGHGDGRNETDEHVADTASTSRVEPRPGATADLQRRIGVGVAAVGTDGRRAEPPSYTAVLDETLGGPVGTAAFPAGVRKRVRNGVACGAGRAADALGPYDGQLSAETVETVAPADERTPYSPSRIEGYTACGFRFYLRQLLGIDSPDRVTRDPDAAERGRFVHATLAEYYERGQTDGAPVDPRGDREERARLLLDVATEQIDDHLDGGVTPFAETWLRQCLAGLATPAANDYYRAHNADSAETDTADDPRGLFVRFLDTEAEQIGKTTARPTRFEVEIGSDDPVQIDTPRGPVGVHGIVDRIDTVPEREPTGVVVRDYKTGSTPSTADTVGGLAFQLPLYAHLAEQALDGETLGGAYYRVAAPTTTTTYAGAVTADEHAAYYRSDDPGTAMLRYRTPEFDTHEQFRSFLTDTVPERLGTVTASVAGGRFHPTLLGPDEAGCDHCAYAHVCDVRHHRRRDVIEWVEGRVGSETGPGANGDTDHDDDEPPVYVPPAATGGVN